MLRKIPDLVDLFAEKVREKLSDFVNTRVGQWFMSLPLLGPVIFLPVQWTAWTTENIAEFQDITWPLMIVSNISVFIGLCFNGDWRLRLSLIFWIQTMVSITLAGWIRG
ncbi:hypothetical protein H6777_02465 [Candidatus Nomurabacteria bacterium]|nr:hypothetical protein [Candidatus Nomurabacteria bacterium]